MLKVRTVYIYLTERCNLDCVYCYCRGKSGKGLGKECVGRFLDLFGRDFSLPGDVEISGGEPFTDRSGLYWLVDEIERRLPGVRIGVQSNALLLSARDIGFIRRHHLSLEVGIDGRQAATTRYRRGMGQAGFARLVRNIQACIQAGIAVSCTMTVHPREASRLAENALFLRQIGIPEIDVTPAAFMPWDKDSVRAFKCEYGEWLKGSDGAAYMGEDATGMDLGALDISLHPPGDILCGDPFLCLPVERRVLFSMWDPERGVIIPSRVRFFRKGYDRYRQGRKGWTHRDHVCSGFRLVNRIMGCEYINVRQMIPLMRFLTEKHSRIRRGSSSGRVGGF